MFEHKVHMAVNCLSMEMSGTELYIKLDDLFLRQNKEIACKKEYKFREIRYK